MKLSNNEFREILVRAQTGDNEAMTDILELYMPLINKHSFVNGKGGFVFLEKNCKSGRKMV